MSVNRYVIYAVNCQATCVIMSDLSDLSDMSDILISDMFCLLGGLTKRIVKLEQPVQAAHPSIVILQCATAVAMARRPNHTGHTAAPAAIGRAPHKLAIYAHFHAHTDSRPALAVDAELQFAAAVALAQPQRYLGVQWQYQRAKAQTAGTDGRIRSDPTSGWMMDPPALSEYAVDPVGVLTRMPSPTASVRK